MLFPHVSSEVFGTPRSPRAWRKEEAKKEEAKRQEAKEESKRALAKTSQAWAKDANVLRPWPPHRPTRVMPAKTRHLLCTPSPQRPDKWASSPPFDASQGKLAVCACAFSGSAFVKRSWFTCKECSLGDNANSGICEEC